MNTEESTEFIREKIKSRPINKEKLLRHTILTGLTAVVFGGVACLSFLLLEPFFSARIAPDEEPAVVTFPTSDDEIAPEDLFADDAEVAAAQEASVAESIQASIEASEQDRIQTAIDRLTLDQSNAAQLYRSLKQIAEAAAPSLVLVRASSREDVFVGGTIERSGEAPGLIIADNGLELLVLTYTSILKNATYLSVTWWDGTRSTATLKGSAGDTGLCVLSVYKRTVSRDTLQEVASTSLGSSASTSLTGMPVIAVGSPTGIYRSVSYGIVTSEKVPVDRADLSLKVYATDIYGGGDSSGFLLNYSGKLVGIIYPEPLEGVDPSRVVAYSVTDARNLIEHLVNGEPLPRLGIHGINVSGEVAEALGISSGAYVVKTDFNAPANAAGLQSGDIIVSFRGESVSSWDDLSAKLEQVEPDTEVSMEILRQGGGEELKMQLNMTTGEVTE